jgi:hypothetical protein
MIRRATALAMACLGAPALAQQGARQIEVEGRALIDQWIAGYNRGDAAVLAKDVYAGRDVAALEKQFTALRADSFGKLDVYSAAFCGSDAIHGKAIVKFARLYTFGGKMNDDEAKVFDLVKTDAGWRVSDETDVPFDTAVSCS